LAETRHILDNTLENNMVEPNIKHELLTWYDTITKRNFFSFKQHIHVQTDELAMRAPSSSILSEIFLQHIQHAHIPHLSMKHRLVNYFRFVDDILLIFDSIKTDIQSILTDFNSLHPNLKFTAEIEQNNTINFLDTTIHRTQDNIKISIYRKPTIIPYTSNHPPQHKYAAVRFLYNRLNTYQLHTNEYKHEKNIIHNIIHNNSFPIRLQRNPTHRHKHTTPPSTPNLKLATLTYTGKETTYITNLFQTL
jgi:hypothetical protein